MLSRKRKDGTFRDVVHPLNSDMRKTIEDRVIEEYNRVGTLDSSEMYTDED